MIKSYIDQPKVSVVIPVHNAEPFIYQALESVSNQTYQNFECIVVNGGSTDRSFNIIEEFIKQDNRFFAYNISNLGSGSVHRKFGIDKAKTDLIFNLDADDFISLDCLEKMIYKMLSTKVDIVLQKSIAFNNDDINQVMWQLPLDIFNFSAILSGKECCKLTISGWKVSCAGMLVKRSLYSLFQVDNLMNADEMISRNLLINAENISFAESVYYYRNNIHSISRAISPRVFERLLLDIQLEKFVEQHYGYCDDIYYRLLKSRINNLINMQHEFCVNQKLFSYEQKIKIIEILQKSYDSIKFISYRNSKDFFQDFLFFKSFRLFKINSYVLVSLKTILGKKYIYK